jgi:hypothetical protein
MIPSKAQCDVRERTVPQPPALFFRQPSAGSSKVRPDTTRRGVPMGLAAILDWRRRIHLRSDRQVPEDCVRLGHARLRRGLEPAAQPRWRKAARLRGERPRVFLTGLRDAKRLNRFLAVSERGHGNPFGC